MTKSTLAAAHSMCELRCIILKTVITVVDILLIQYPHTQVVVYVVCCWLILYYSVDMVSAACHPEASHTMKPGMMPPPSLLSMHLSLCKSTAIRIRSLQLQVDADSIASSSACLMRRSSMVQQDCI